MDFFKSTSFWVGFAAAMLITLLVGGLLSALLEKCPAFGPLLLISLGAALLGGFAAQQLFANRVEAATERASGSPLQARIAEARQRLSQSTLSDRLSAAADQLSRLETRLSQ